MKVVSLTYLRIQFNLANLANCSRMLNIFYISNQPLVIPRKYLSLGRYSCAQKYKDENESFGQQRHLLTEES